MNIEIPDSYSTQIQRAMELSGLSSPEEYILKLVEEDAASDKLEGLLLEGLNSGDSIEISEGFWEEQKRQFFEEHPDTEKFL